MCVPEAEGCVCLGLKDVCVTGVQECVCLGLNEVCVTGSMCMPGYMCMPGSETCVCLGLKHVRYLGSNVFDWAHVYVWGSRMYVTEAQACGVQAYVWLGLNGVYAWG